MAGDARPSPGYYVAIALLAVGLLAGASLFFLLATRSQTSSPTIDTSAAQPTPCPVGSRAPGCFSFIVTNTGHEPLNATCQLASAAGTNATFDDGTVVKLVSLFEGQPRTLTVRVQADGSDTVAAPKMQCDPTAA
jgi:hypothetical protein